MKEAVSTIQLEKITQDFIDKLQAAGGPPIYKLSPDDARALLEKVQSEPIETPAVQRDDLQIPGIADPISVQIVRPADSVDVAVPIIFYLHGGGWILGSQKTHARLTAEIASGTKSAVVFINYTLSPEAKFPSSIEESFTAAKYIVDHAEEYHLDPTKISIAGDSVGGNMAIALTQLALSSKALQIDKLLLFYPVTDGAMSSNSYSRFADGPWLTKPAMEWFWNAYEPVETTRSDPLLSPVNAPLQLLSQFPPTLVITAKNDVLRDEGLAFADKLLEAGATITAVCFEGTIHDFVMLNALAKTNATRGAIEMAIRFLS